MSLAGRLYASGLTMRPRMNEPAGIPLKFTGRARLVTTTGRGRERFVSTGTKQGCQWEHIANHANVLLLQSTRGHTEK